MAAGGAGGGIDASAGTTTLYNSLVAKNTAGTGSSATTSDISGSLALASANNLIGGVSSGLTNGVNGNLIGVNAPKLGPLADNGGPTQTVALLSGSPAIDAGALSFVIVGGTINAPTLDQRGGVRGPAGLNAGTTVDIGAYEATSSYRVSATGDTSSNSGTLRSAVGWANANQNNNPANIKAPAPNTIVFTSSQPITLSGGALVLSNSVTPISITGPGANLLTLSASNGSRVFQVTAGTKASISGVTITGGSALATGGQSGLGGGIDNFGNLTLSGIAISGNSAINGGGFANEAKATASIVNSTVSSNTATTGGGIYNAGTLSVSNSTIAGNFASSQGGGVANFGTLSTVSTTIAHNNVASGGTGGGLQNNGGVVGLYNTIVSQNTAGTTSPATYSDVAGAILPASSNNLIGSDATAGLGTLASNGGPTQTIALLAGSPAIGAGSSTISGVTVPTTDQRGSIRPANGIDIGAFQSGTFTPAIVTTTPIAPAATPATNAITTVATTAVITTPAPTAATTIQAVVTPTPVVKVTAKRAAKLKVTHKKAHPGGGAATKFHKKPAVAKARHHSAVVKLHRPAHAKKK